VQPAPALSAVDHGERGRDLLQRLALGIDAEHDLDQALAASMDPESR
jgi:hypothetical protein